MKREFDRKLILEDGSEYYGYGYSIGCETAWKISDFWRGKGRTRQGATGCFGRNNHWHFRH